MSEIQTKTLPLSTEDIIAFFDNPETSFLIDYNKSTIKEESFLTYIANMKIKCDILEYRNIPLEERKSLLKNYIKFNYIIDALTLQLALVSVLFYYRKKELFFDYFTEEEMESFISENKEEINNIAIFFESMLLLIPSISLEFKEHVFEPMVASGEIETINDPNAIGINVFGLIGFPNFIDFFIGFSEEILEIKYYKFQIENLSYKNKRFYDLVKDLSSPSALMSIFNIFSSTDEETINYFEKIKQDVA